MSPAKPMPYADDEGLRAFFAKATAREPLLDAALPFVPAEILPRFMAWTALLAELRECVFELSDPRVTSVKTGWWVEELEGLSRGAARHPVTRMLVQTDAPWDRWAAPLLSTARDLDPPGDAKEAVERLLPLAEAIVSTEHRVFGIEVAPAAAEAQGRTLAIHWLRHRLETGLQAQDRARIPLQFFARHGVRREHLAEEQAAALRQDWAHWLLATLPGLPARSAALPRLLSSAADQRVLRGLAEGRPVSASGNRFASVWQAWRLARNAAFQTPGASDSRT